MNYDTHYAASSLGSALCGALKPADFPLVTTSTADSVTCIDCVNLMVVPDLPPDAAIVRHALQPIRTYAAYNDVFTNVLTLLTTKRAAIEEILSPTIGKVKPDVYMDMLGRLTLALGPKKINVVDLIHGESVSLDTWPLSDVLFQMAKWLQHLGTTHNCDCHGWEAQSFLINAALQYQDRVIGDSTPDIELAFEAARNLIPQLNHVPDVNIDKCCESEAVTVLAQALRVFAKGTREITEPLPRTKGLRDVDGTLILDLK